MRHSFSAGRADAVPARPSTETTGSPSTTASLALAASAHSSSRPGSLTPRSCSVSSWHGARLLFHRFSQVLECISSREADDQLKFPQTRMLFYLKAELSPQGQHAPIVA